MPDGSLLEVPDGSSRADVDKIYNQRSDQQVTSMLDQFTAQDSAPQPNLRIEGQSVDPSRSFDYKIPPIQPQRPIDEIRMVPKELSVNNIGSQQPAQRTRFPDFVPRESSPKQAGWGETLKSIPSLAAESFKQSIGGGAQAWGMYGTALQNIAEPDSPVGRFKPGTKAIEVGKAISSAARKKKEEITPKNQTFWQEAVTQAGVSGAQQLPLLGLSVLTGGGAMPVVAGFGALEFGRSYDDALEKSKNPITAFRHATTSGLLEAGTELLPAKALLKKGNPFFKRLVNFLSAEVPGENIASLGQMVSELQHDLREDITVKDVVDTVKMTTAATLIGGGAQVTASHYLHKIKDNLSKKPEPEEPVISKMETTEPVISEAEVVSDIKEEIPEEPITQEPLAPEQILEAIPAQEQPPTIGEVVPETVQEPLTPIAEKAEEPLVSKVVLSKQDQGKGTPITEIHETVKPIIDKWPGVNVEIVQSANELPGDMFDQVRLQQAEKEVSGIYNTKTNQIFLVGDNVKDIDTAQKVVLHEAVGHLGLRKVMGEELAPTLKQVAFSYGKDGMSDIIKNYNLDWSNKTDQLIAAEEMIAHMAEGNTKPGLWKKIVAKVKKWLRKAFPKLKYSDNDIHELLRQSSKSLEKGDISMVNKDGIRMAKKPEEPVLDQGAKQEIPILTERFEMAGTDIEPFLERLTDNQSYKDEVENIIAAKEDEFKGARRGKMTWKETEKKAKEIGLKQLVDRKHGTAMNAEEFEAGRQMLNQAMGELMAQKDKARMGDKRELIKFQAYLDNFKELSKQVVGARAEIGRALGIMRKSTADVKRMDRLLDSMGGAQTIQGKVDALNSLEEREKNWEKKPTEADINKRIIEMAKPTTFDKIYEVWVNGILSGIKTHSVNLFGNASFNVLNTAEQGLASVIGKLHGGDKVYMRELMIRGNTMIEGGREAMGFLSEVWREDIKDPFVEMLSQTNKIGDEVKRFEAISGKKGKIIRMPGRALQVGDVFFKTIAFRQNVKALAARKAIRDQGVKNWKDRAAEIEKTVNDAVTSEDKRDAWVQDIIDKSLNNAEYLTFTKELGKPGKAVQNAIRKIPGMRYIIPFVRTPTNIMKSTLARTPAALAMKETFWGELKKGGAERDVALSRMILGTSIMAMVGSLTVAGLITGGGPEDPRQRALWRRKYQPYSIKGPDGAWIAYNRLDPIGSVIGISADLTTLASTNFKKSEDAIWLTLAAINSNFVDKTWLKGFGDAIRAIQDPQRYGKRWWTNFSGSFMPFSSLVRQSRYIVDPNIRRAESTIDQMKANTPGLSGDIQPMLDLFGNEIQISPQMDTFGRAVTTFLPLYIGLDPNDPVVNEMLDLKVSIGRPSSRINGHKLSQEEHNEYIKLAGEPAYEQLKGMMDGGEWESIPESIKIDLIKDIILSHRKNARSQMKGSYPKLGRSKNDIEKERRAIESGLQ